MTCRLAERPCPRVGRVGVALPLWLPPVAASVPSDMMEMDLPCLWPRPLLTKAPPGEMGDRASSAIDEACSDWTGRWPRSSGEPGICETKDELREMEGLVVEATGGSLRCRSPPGAKPLCLRPGEGSRPPGVATFLKVIVHCTSSPANTVGSFHCTNTRIFDEDMVGRAGGAGGGGFAGGSSGAYVERHGGWRVEGSQKCQRRDTDRGLLGAAVVPVSVMQPTTWSARERLASPRFRASVQGSSSF